ncbi:hypothetical protein ASE09_22765 [Streptomyces sp. Root66D1]|nr:hypothetical protein ASD33_25210 [Streptomyces sp. Root1304]KRA78696.1 hypothetical protein ASE09_22765 [Streptomyces sp. Root66D1]
MRVLAALLLTPVVALAVLYAVSRVREAGREREAFEATRADARRFADALVAAGDSTPSAQDVRDVLDGGAGPVHWNGTLHEVLTDGRGTRVVVLFSHRYEQALAVFGPADAWAGRCFTLDFPARTAPAAGPGEPRPRITAYGADESCAEVRFTGWP